MPGSDGVRDRFATAVEGRPVASAQQLRNEIRGKKVGNVLTGDFVFTSWVDHAAKRVMITEIADAE